MKMINMTETRRVELDGAYNFRDLGGYLAAEGKTTRWRKLYRSDNLAKLTKRDLERLENLNLKLIIDLRSKEEWVVKPNRLPDCNGVRIKNIEIYDSNKSYNDLIKEILNGELGETDLKEDLLNIYSRAVSDYQNELSSFFNLLLDPANFPALILCNAGKDRTGVASALVLMALGVSQELILTDYMLSKVYLAPMIKRLIAKIRLLSLFRADIGQLENLLDTRVEYLMATFMAINQKFGSPESFLDTIGMDSKNRKLLRHILCS